jgi:hypothetical protein
VTRGSRSKLRCSASRFGEETQDPRRRVNMQAANLRARMTNPAMVLLAAMQALLALG